MAAKTDKVAYYRRTDKSLLAYKNIQNSTKVLLTALDEEQWHTFYSIYCIYDCVRQDETNKEHNLRHLTPNEMAAVIEGLEANGWLERLIMDPTTVKKWRSMQSFLDGNY